MDENHRPVLPDNGTQRLRIDLQVCTNGVPSRFDVGLFCPTISGIYHRSRVPTFRRHCGSGYSPNSHLCCSNKSPRSLVRPFGCWSCLSLGIIFYATCIVASRCTVFPLPPRMSRPRSLYTIG